MATAIVAAAIGAAGAIGSTLIANSGSKQQVAPVAAPEQVMPLPDDQEIRRAKKNSIVRQMSRGGRSSTILTQDSGTLGGGYG